MTPEQWERVGAVYHAALERSSDKRISFVAEACSGNAQLRREVELLLAAEQGAADFLQADALHDFARHDFGEADANQANRVEPQSLIGQNVGDYELLSHLGAGGMGEVYRARSHRLGRQAAIKILPAGAADADRLRRFEQEAHAASALNHPNIVTIYETGEAAMGPFLAMELVEGETLRQVVNGRPPLDVVMKICIQAAQALKVAHAANIVHRDIKPENLILRPDGYVKVLDFGLACLLPRSASRKSQSSYESAAPEMARAGTKAGMVIGTSRYMSPEQARGEQVTGASDVFSFGLVMYELATGLHPFRAETEFGTLDAILSRAVLAPSRINPNLSAAWEALILCMLDKRADARPSAAEVEQTLAEIRHRDEHAGGAFGRAAARRIVGRVRELDELDLAWASAANGRGMLCCVSGEPGIGKTTLVEEFLYGLGASGRSSVTARGCCSERLAGTDAYSPFLDAVGALQQGSSSVAKAVKRLAPTWYGQIVSDRANCAVTANPGAGRPSSPEQMKREFGALLQELSARQTLVLLLEDVHWADISTVDLLAFLAGRISSWRLLIVVTYRTSDLLLAKHPFLQLKQHLLARGVAHEIKLGFLSQEEVGRYLALEFPRHRLPPDVPALIHAKTEGNPLFMTDLVRYLRNRQIVAEKEGSWVLNRPLPEVEHDLPESTRAMIERKIGQLDEGQRRLLVAASVQGYEFDSAVLAYALRMDDVEVEESLDVLERVHAFAVLIDERELPTKTITLHFRFTHVLYQNALYATLRPARRAAMSKAVAGASLALYGAAAAASQLARLFEVAREFVPAAEYYLIGATDASRIFAAREAVALARRGLSLLQSTAQTAKSRNLEFSLHLLLGNALLVTAGYGDPEVEQIYRRARDLCEGLGDRAELLPVLYGLWVFQLIHSGLDQALEFGREFLQLAQEVKSAATLVGERMLGCPLFYLGRFSQALPRFERAMAAYDQSMHGPLAWRYGQDAGVTTRTYLAWTMWLLGYPDRAVLHNREARRLGDEMEHALSRGHALFFAAIHAYFRRDWDDFRALAHELVQLAQERELKFWLYAGQVVSGFVTARHGNANAGIKEMNSGIQDSLAAGTELNHTVLYALLAEAYSESGQPKQGLAAIGSAFSVVERTRECWFEAELHRLRGELLLQQGETGYELQAEQCFRRAMQIAQGQQAKSLELRAAKSLSRLWARHGERCTALSLLEPVYGWFTEGLETPDLREARALIEELQRVFFERNDR